MQTHIRPNKTVIGVGNVALSGGGLYLYRSTNVIIRNLTIVDSSEDDLGIHYSDHVWIDHCTFLDATDGELDITQSSDYITVSWCKFGYTANPPALDHKFVSLIAASDSDNGTQYHVTYHHNWWSDGCVERMPSVRFGRVHCFNNYYNAPGNNYCVRTRIAAELRVENNFFQNVQNPWEQYVTGATGTQGKLFAANNNVPFLGTAFGVTWTGTTTNKDGTIRYAIPGTDTVFAAPYSYTLDASSAVPNLVTNNAGASKGPFAP
jgi:pectate lyase